MTGYAFFDLDGTLLPFDTQLLFANHVLRRHPWRRGLLLPFWVATPFAGSRLLRSREMKRLFLAYSFRMSPDELDRLAREFVEAAFPLACYPEVLEEIERHRREGRTLVLNTASPDIYARHIARALNFDHCFATKVVLENPMPLVPDIDGDNNKRSAKLHAMRELLGPSFDPEHPTEFPNSWAYSDSSVDSALLSCAEHKTVVNPNTSLGRLALAGDWHVMRPSRPFRGPIGKHISITRQIFGFYRPPWE